MKVWPLKRPDVPLVSSYILVKHMVHSHKKVYYESQICHQKRSNSFPSKLETIPNKTEYTIPASKPNKVSQRSSAIPSNGNGDTEKQLCRQILWLEQLPGHGDDRLQQNSITVTPAPAHCRSPANICVYYSRSMPITSQSWPNEKVLSRSTFNPLHAPTLLRWAPLIPNTSNSI